MQLFAELKAMAEIVDNLVHEADDADVTHTAIAALNSLEALRDAIKKRANNGPA